MADSEKKAKSTKPKKEKQASPKKQPKKDQEKLLSVLKTICIIAVVLILLMVAAQRFGDITFSSVGDYVNTLISGAKSGDGYPYHFENLRVRNVLPMGSDLFVLADDETFVLDRTARTVGKTQLSYSSPSAVTAGGRTLVFDIGEHGYRILSKTKVLYEGDSPQKILNGAISKSGNIVLSTRGDASQTKLTVYNKHQKEIFTWNCASENIIALAISDNGKRVAASVVGAENGELYTKVYMFDIDKTDPMLSLQYTGAVPNLTFLSGNRLLVTGEHIFEIYDGNEKIFEEDMSVNPLSHVFTSESKCTVAAFSKYGSASAKIIRVYDRKGVRLFETEITESVQGVSTDGQSISILTDTMLYNYNRQGELVGKAPVEAGEIAPFTCGKWTYVWTVGGIERFKTAEISENEEPETQTISPTEETEKKE